LVWPALILFATVEELFIPYWFGIVIFLRDLAMTILRAVVKKKTGVSMKTSYWGKSKSAVQMFTVITILLILSFMGTEQGILKAFVDFALDKKIPFWSMALCVFLTLLSMLVYFADNREALAKLGSSK
jgi:phosphatidylglycerophosphate synthase